MNILNNYRIIETAYARNGRRHTEEWIVKARREPTPDEVRDRWSIPTRNQIRVAKIEFPTWDLPGVVPYKLSCSIQKYLGYPPFHRLGPAYLNAGFLQFLKEKYGSTMVVEAIRELS